MEELHRRVVTESFAWLLNLIDYNINLLFSSQVYIVKNALFPPRNETAKTPLLTKNNIAGLCLKEDIE
jgi:hypothetical protein